MDPNATKTKDSPRRRPQVRRWPRRWPHLCLLSFLSSCVLACPFPSARAQSSPTEYEVKAAFLFNFAKFVEWPVEKMPDQRTDVCVLGDDPFGPLLESTFRERTLNGHRLNLKRSRRLQDLSDCEILFISSSEQIHIQEILGNLRGQSILTVGELDHFAESGGMIGFVMEENRVRFAVNVDAARRANLKISSKLLSLARIVHDEPPRNGG